jgi:2-isopropylmalate synthase
MNELGITIADIGLPGAGMRAYNDVLALATFARNKKLRIKLNCAARTHIKDIEPIARIQQIVGIPITAYCFLGTSPIRQMVEDWDLDKLKFTTDEAVTFAQENGLSVAFVTEDTTRSGPETLKPLFEHALDLGVERLVLCDTVGHATPIGIKALIDFASTLIRQRKSPAVLDWHGHNDRGLAVSNAIFAAEYGCKRIHGTALGVGERVGNTAIDQLLINLKLLNAYQQDLHALPAYLAKVSEACGIPIPYNYPVFGNDAFRTATGVHASAVIKAMSKKNELLANLIYSGVPAHWFGKQQKIEIGPMSGASNVRHWLSTHGISEKEELILALLGFAKEHDRVLRSDEIMRFINDFKKGTLPGS